MVREEMQSLSTSNFLEDDPEEVLRECRREMRQAEQDMRSGGAAPPVPICVCVCISGWRRSPPCGRDGLGQSHCFIHVLGPFLPNTLMASVPCFAAGWSSGSAWLYHSRATAQIDQGSSDR